MKDSLSKAYYGKKQAEGESKTKALRCLKRRLARILYNTLQTDRQTITATCQPAAA